MDKFRIMQTLLKQGVGAKAITTQCCLNNWKHTKAVLRPNITSAVFSETRQVLQSAAANRVHVPARWRASAHGSHCTGLAPEDLLRFQTQRRPN